MTGVVPVFILLHEASNYTFLDLAFDLVDFVLCPVSPQTLRTKV